MAERTQTSRQVAISTPLGEDVLLFRRATIIEHLGRMFQMEVDVFTEEKVINFADIVGQNVTIRLEHERDGSPRFFNGYVTRIIHTGGSERVAHYRLTLCPWLWFLTRTSDCRMFQKMKAPDIIVQIFRDKGFTDFSIENLHGTYAEREYCVQYRETDFNFVSRLMEEEGIYYYFKHEDGKHTMMLCDSSTAHQAFAGFETMPYFPPNDASRDEDYIWEWQIEQEVQPGKYSVTDYHFETPGTDLSNTATKAREHAAPDLEMFDYHPGRYKESSDAESLSKIRLEEYQAYHEIIRAAGDVRGTCCGSTFTLDGLSEAQDKEHLITSVVHQLESDEYSSTTDGDNAAPIYECTFTAILATQQYRPKRITPKPMIYGPQTAFVTGPSGEEIHTDEYGRVKVQFHWDRVAAGDDTTSCWCRVGQMWAGKGWGGLVLPRIGQEVIVAFLEGDPDQPLIVGCVYNADSMPAYKLPDFKNLSGMKSNTVKGGGFNEIRMDDTDGEQQFFMHAQKNQDIRVGNDKYEFIGNDRHTVVVNDKVEHVKNDKHELVKNDNNVEIGRDHNIKVTGKQAIEIGDSHSVKVKGKVIQEYTGNHSEKCDADIYIKGANICIEADTNITLKVGGTSIAIESGGIKLDTTGEIELTSTGDTKCKAMNWKAEAQMEFGIKGMMVKSEASVQNDVKGLLTNVTADAMLTLKGGVTMIN